MKFGFFITKWFISVCGVLTVVLFIVQQLAFSQSFWNEELQRHPPDQAIPIIRAKAEMADTIDYVQHGSTLERGFYTIREHTHLQDVRRLWLQILSVGVVCVVATGLATGWYISSTGWRAVLRLIRQSAWFAIAAVGLCISIALTAFSTAFTAIHTLVFDNDYWLLDPASEWLVVVFPPTGFLRLVVLTLTWLAVVAGLLIVVTSRFLSHQRQR